ncbi:MAG: hypothetical protein PHI85_06845 [Victivallaceae bacterium]|nr:hypothetical protein [Victivallaceae bacterium]
MLLKHCKAIAPNHEFSFKRYAYNPVEQIWQWLKPRVCGRPKAMNGGCSEIVSRIRKISNARTLGRLATNPKIGIGIWQDLLFNYL